MKNYLIILIALISILFTACNHKPAYEDLNDPSFPTSGDDASGNDALSGSTNFSAKEADNAPQLSALSGASFVQAPQINNYGAVSLGYTIEVPAGRAGLQPQLSLGYSSSSGDGICGIGWNLSTGLGVISRTTQNGELCYDERDTFTYNGSRLVKVDGPTNSADGTYRLEIESLFVKLTLSDSASGGIWTVQDKRGTVYLFGEDQTSRIYQPADQTKVYTWNFARAFDLNGNYMVAVYDYADYAVDHMPYLKEIKYTGNIKTGLAPKEFVRLNYKKRSDPYVTKSAGFIMRLSRQLDEVEVGYDGDVLWNYEMVYEDSADSGRPLLKTVNSSKYSTQPNFTYQPAVHSLVWQKPENRFYNDTEINPASVKYFEGDFNGDGISDMLFFNPVTGDWKTAEAVAGGGYTFKVYGNKFKGYDRLEKIQFFKGGASGDYNGDGRSDIAFYLPETKEFWVAEHNGTNFEFRCYGKLAYDIDLFACEWFPGDYDGNGLSDTLLFNEPTGQWILMRNVGGAFSFSIIGNTWKNLYRYDFNPDASLNSSFTFDASAIGEDKEKVSFLCGDYNGDGKTDISFYDARTGNWWVGENYRDTSNHSSVSFRLQWKLYKAFTAPESALFTYDRFSGDFNGDGFSDFLLFDKSEGEWILGETGDGTITFKKWSAMPNSNFNAITRWLQGDFNGDGRTDIGFYSATDNNFWIGEATTNGFRYRIYSNLSGGPDRDKVMKTPLPKDEITLETRSGYVIGTTPQLLNYQYDANYYTGHGEEVWAGSFTGSAGRDLLIYKRAEKKLYLQKNGNNRPAAANAISLDMSVTGTKLLGNNVPHFYRSDRESLMLYCHESGKHNFKLISADSDRPVVETVAALSDSAMSGFNVDSSMWLSGAFDNSAASILVLNDSAKEIGTGIALPDFLYVNGSSTTSIGIELYQSTTEQSRAFAQKFISWNQNSQKLMFFTAFVDGKTQVVLGDYTTSEAKWYKGELDVTGKIITFKPLAFSFSFSPAGYTRQYASDSNGNVVLALGAANAANFVKFTVTGDSIALVSRYTPSGSFVFRGQFSAALNPAVETDAGVKIADVVNKTLTAVTGDVKFTREDLLDDPDFYPYMWLQGDYNGDSKTDIGIVHLKDRYWYFAQTTGTVPDLIQKVDNGIGGTYEMEYVNSTSLDNRGTDGLSHLPMNYKVCSALEVHDGRGNYIKTNYNYSGGYAFSSFINGRKETDYFGFSRFEVVDSLGARNITTYNTTPYSDFRANRALAGAIKGTQFIGRDGKEYERSEYTYKLHEITTSYNGGTKSWLVEPASVKTYKENHLYANAERETTLDGYGLKSTLERSNDYYADSVHSAATLSSITYFENISSTNETRPTSKKTLNGTAYENTVYYAYDERGNVESEILRYTGSGLPTQPDRVMNYEYDAYGNRNREVNASGSPNRITEKFFDDQLHQFVVGEKVYTDWGSLNSQYKLSYGVAFGGVTEKIDVNGNSSYYEYDSLGRLSKQYADTNSGKKLLHEYKYTSSFPLRGEVKSYSGNDGSDVAIAQYVDGMGRVLATVRKADNGRYVQSGAIVYDPVGRVIRQSQPDWCDQSAFSSYKSPSIEKNPTITTFDGAGRVGRVTLPKTISEATAPYTSYSYISPWETVETLSVGRSKRTVKNGRGQILYVEDYGTGDDGKSVRAKIGFAYDLAGHRIKKIDLGGTTLGVNTDVAMTLDVDSNIFGVGKKDTSGNNVAAWRYDGFGELVEASDPDLGYSRFTYTPFGEVSTSTDALGRTTELVYDRLGRMVEKRLPGSEGNVRYYYDEYKTGIFSGADNALGRLVAIDDMSEHKDFSYDKMGRTIKETRSITLADPDNNDLPRDYETLYEHDLTGRITEITYPKDVKFNSRLTVNYTYGASGVEKVTTSMGLTDNKTLVNNITYNEFGQQLTVTRGNNTVTNYEYDARGRLSHLTTTNKDGLLMQNVAYNLKADNTIIEITNSSNDDGERSAKYSYSYDGLNRLIGANGNYNSTDVSANRKFQQNFSYSASGNMLSRSENIEKGSEPSNGLVTLNYTYSNHAVTEIRSGSGVKQSMNYDACGNMIRQSDVEKNLVKELQFDSQNRITQVNDALGQETGRYGYDDQGFRVYKKGVVTENNETRVHELFYPNKYFCIEVQSDKDGNLLNNGYNVSNNIYLNGLRIAAVIPSGDSLYFLTDQVDSVKLVVNDSGKAVSRMEYLPFGEMLVQEGDKNFNGKFNSQELDKETSFYFYNARYYDPAICRFVTADNVIDGEYDTQGWNRYAYVRNNPVCLKDPSGHDTKGKVAGGTFFGMISLGNPLITAGGVWLGDKIGDKISGKKETTNQQNNSTMTQQQFDDFKNDVKNQLVSHLQTPTGVGVNSRARESIITVNNKTIKINFREDFCISMIGIKTPDEVISGFDKDVFGVLMKTAFENNASEFTVVGLQRPSETSYSSPGSLHVNNKGIDIINMQFNDGSPVETMSGTINHTDNSTEKMNKIISDLKNNVENYTQYEKVEIMCPKVIYKKYNNGTESSQENAGVSNNDNLHKTHLHFGFR